MFQSPSLRGSGRFATASECRAPASPRRFNPLHCGAVVASALIAAPVPAVVDVSIPFIAGQWSLHKKPDKKKEEKKCFNPLHCGAVVASDRPPRRTAGAGPVSIPFIAGQWSLRSGRAAGAAVPLVAFQSPSLRGSGRFRAQEAKLLADLNVSIPFIAGQWSLLDQPPAEGAAPTRFNPLHCGAVVASRRAAAGPPGGERVSIPFIAGQWSLRAPLPRRGEGDPFVSIPFIAGQWSLRV